MVCPLDVDDPEFYGPQTIAMKNPVVKKPTNLLPDADITDKAIWTDELNYLFNCQQHQNQTAEDYLGQVCGWSDAIEYDGWICVVRVPQTSCRAVFERPSEDP
jgi:hypothetical protein